MKTYFEKELELGCLSFYAIINLKKIVWLPTFTTYKLEAIAFNWLCFIIGVYINDKEE
jgi:hypothetical protein